MQFGPVFIDLNAINLFFTNQSPAAIFVQLLALGGWLFIVKLLFIVGLAFWVDYKESRYTSSWKWVLLAVDIPALNLQTPKAVEQMFAHLAGALGHDNIASKFWNGNKQRYFSFEIVSIDGYIQFLIRTEEALRDLVEASVYAQYPEAEIIEVEDYTESKPSKFPDSVYNIWASDIALTENDALPLRTFKDFEHNISKDTQLKDPMSALLESFSRIGTGEEIWFQIIIQPTDNGWKEKAIAKIKEKIGDTSGGHGHGGNPILDFIHNAPLQLIEFIGDQIFNREAGEHDAHEEHDGPPNQLQYLTPGESKLVEAMETKISKIGFKTKMRAIYIARKEVFSESRGVQALVGALNQFNSPSANSLSPTFGVHMSYWRSSQRSAERKSLLMKAYKKRKMNVGANSFILNIEELATIWHFPMSYVKTPLLQKAVAKQSEPPASLPIERIFDKSSEPEDEPEPPPMRFG